MSSKEGYSRKKRGVAGDISTVGGFNYDSGFYEIEWMQLFSGLVYFCYFSNQSDIFISSFSSSLMLIEENVCSNAVVMFLM